MTTKYRAYNTLLISIISILLINCSFGQALSIIISPTPSLTQMSTFTPTQTASLTSAPTQTKAVTLLSLITPSFEGASIVGMWERHGVMENRAYTEHLNFMVNGTYHVEADYDDNSEVIASMDGTYTYDKVNIYYFDKNHKKTTESYKLNSAGDTLIIKNDAAHPWKHIK
jgi:hypothetical protein